MRFKQQRFVWLACVSLIWLSGCQGASSERGLGNSHQAIEPGTNYVTRTVEERLAPKRSGKVTNRIHRQEEVEVYEIRGKWARVSRFYNGRIEGLSGQVARWVEIDSLSKQRPGELPQPTMTVDDRIQGIPKVGEGGLTNRDVQILYAAAHYYLESGQAKAITYGDKSVSKSGVYYLNLDDAMQNHFFRSRDIPDLEQRIKSLHLPK